jgi:hypothetical protein
MAALTREMILALQQTPLPLQLEAVACPELGTDTVMYVRMMDSARAERYERTLYATNRDVLNALSVLAGDADAEEMTIEEAEAQLQAAPSIRVALVIQTACDSDGAPLFTRDDTAWLSAQPAPLVKRLFDAAWTLNQLGADAVEAAIKNSASSQSADSGTN